MKQRQTDILISGGGIAGLTLAVILARAGLSVDLVDPAPPQPLEETQRSGRTVALMDTSVNIIRAAGIWEKLSGAVSPLRTMRIMDDSRPGRDMVESAFHAEDIGLEQFGFNTPNALLRAALFEQAGKEPHITLHTPDSLSQYEVAPAHIQATLESGRTIRAQALVGADGRNSAVRRISGIDVWKQEYDQAAITCIINHARSHNNVSTEFHRPAGPLAFVPLPGNQSSVVWVENREKANDIIALRKHEFEQRLQKSAHNILGGITLETGPECWPLCSIKAKTLTAPRTALIAEAAHVMSPITAQGLNLSLRDVAALAETLVDAVRIGMDPGADTVLARYEKRRRLDIGTRVFGVDGMNRIVSTHLEFIKGARRAGLKALNDLPPLKRLAMRQGLAPQNDIGRLARGEAL